MNETSTDSEQKEQTKQRSFPERLSFGIAICILGLLIFLILYQWKVQENEPPILTVTLDQEIRYFGTQFYVPFTVYNIGGQTVKSVQVVGELQIEDENLQQGGEQQIDFLSAGEKASGAFIFTRNPEDGKLIIRVASYKLP
ncbi:TIGR02588 family protein [Capilliphycus salinus ALCB114379]|uniref:TIGR02588 family protein n=1 Tax=Capilliphycus salinus TaxID=2768948 RepID=UPI0039A489BB